MMYELTLKPVNEMIGCYKVGVPEWKPYEVEAGAKFTVKKLEGEVKVVFAMGADVFIPINEHFFKAKKVTIKKIVKKEKVW